jgi:transcriptional regulator with XRE-family HTH domain
MMIPDVKAIRDAREAQGLTLDEAAKRAGFVNDAGTVQRQNWYRLESGHRREVSADTLYRIAKALRRRMEDLLIDEADAEKRDARRASR